jgi:hypothetical protein
MPTGPDITKPTAASTWAKVQFAGLSISDAGQDPLGAWQYSATVTLRETAGVDVTVTNISYFTISGPDRLASASITLMSSVSANSSGDTTFVFKSDRHAQASTIDVNLAGNFKDANGHYGSFSDCFWTSNDAVCWLI